MNKYKIYCYTNIINGKKYIGQTCQSLKRRSGPNGEYYANRNYPKDDYRQPPFYKAIQKYGWNNFIVEILEDNLTLEQANAKEEYWISYYHTYIDDPLNQGYNVQKGGLNKTWTNEERIRMSMQRKGHPVSEETKEKIRKANLGKKMSDEAKEKIRQAHIGMIYSDETKKKLSEQRKGVPKSEEHKKKIGKSNSKAVLCIETGIIYNSCTEATYAVGLKNPISISAVCRGKGKTAAGYHWKYIEEDK